MATVEHTAIIRCVSPSEYQWVLAQLQASANDPENPIQAISPFLPQLRINVTFVPKEQLKE